MKPPRPEPKRIGVRAQAAPPLPSPLERALEHLPARLIAGVSGGVDSVALLHALVAAGRQPIVAHFDHAWRAESRAEVLFVRALARTLGLRFVEGKARKSAALHRETEARTERYAFFSAAARKFGVDDLVLAHHADDQVETFLLQLFRGGGSGARGMDPVTRRGAIVLHRPWLGIWKKDIVAYARQRRLEWRDDASNAHTRHRRNNLRQRILPYLRREISPQVAENLWRAAEISRAEGEWLDSLCAADASAAELDVKKLRAKTCAQQRRTVLRWLRARGITNISFADVETVRALLEKVSPARVNLSAGKFARRRAGQISVE